MKTHTFLLALTLVAFSFGLKAHSSDTKENKETSTQTEILDIVDTEDLFLDECVACPVAVQVFDKDFNLLLTGEMSPLQETDNQKLQVMIGQSNLIIDSGNVVIYQLEE